MSRSAFIEDYLRRQFLLQEYRTCHNSHPRSLEKDTTNAERSRRPITLRPSRFNQFALVLKEYLRVNRYATDDMSSMSVTRKERRFAQKQMHKTREPSRPRSIITIQSELKQQKRRIDTTRQEDASITPITKA
jgi:hypothetical protein